MDIIFIIRVVQFMIPSSLSVWLQRYGRAGRAGQLSIVVLLVEPAVYEVKKPPKRPATKHRRVEDSDDEQFEEEDVDELEEDNEAQEEVDALDAQADERDEPPRGLTSTDSVPEYRKKVEVGMRQWIEAPDCRRTVTDAYFDNPRRTQGKSHVYSY